MLTLLAQLTPRPPAEGKEVEWVLSALRWGVEQFSQRNYVAGAGVVVMLAVFAGNRFLPQYVSKERAPFISAGLGVLGAVGVNLTALLVGATPIDWLTAIGTGLFAGASASGFWSLAGKKAVEKLVPPKE